MLYILLKNKIAELYEGVIDDQSKRFIEQLEIYLNSKPYRSFYDVSFKDFVEYLEQQDSTFKKEQLFNHEQGPGREFFKSFSATEKPFSLVEQRTSQLLRLPKTKLLFRVLDYLSFNEKRVLASTSSAFFKICYEHQQAIIDKDFLINEVPEFSKWQLDDNPRAALLSDPKVIQACKKFKDSYIYQIINFILNELEINNNNFLNIAAMTGSHQIFREAWELVINLSNQIYQRFYGERTHYQLLLYTFKTTFFYANSDICHLMWRLLKELSPTLQPEDIDIPMPIREFVGTECNLLHRAALSQNPSAIEFCLKYFKFEVNQPIQEGVYQGWYPLHFAAYPWYSKYEHTQDRIGTLELLIDAHKAADPNFDIESITTSNGDNVLDIADINEEKSKEVLFFLKQIQDVRPSLGVAVKRCSR